MLAQKLRNCNDLVVTMSSFFCLQLEDDKLPLLLYAGEVNRKVSECLPRHWLVVPEEGKLNLLLLSRDAELTTQRRVSVSYDGTLDISVHRMKPSMAVLQAVVSKVKLMHWSSVSAGDFADSVLQVLNEVRKYEVCVGCEGDDFKCLWSSTNSGRVDVNPYGESRYCQTLRSNSCHLLISPSKYRCMSCYKLSQLLRKRMSSRRNGLKLTAPNIHLTESEKIKKMEYISRQLHSRNKLVMKLQRKIDVAPLA